MLRSQTYKFIFPFFLTISILLTSCASTENVRSEVFISGTDGYHTYRIPALVNTNEGTLLAFCEGRKDSRSDAGNVDLLVKRSCDQGKTWSQQQIIWNDRNNTCGNPCPIVDRETGNIYLLMTWNRGDDSEKEIINNISNDTRRVFISSSNDDGQTWEIPREITDDVKLADWTWYATGPGAGIQIERGNFRGRLVAPCDHIELSSKNYYSHIIYSDDHGESWKLGGSTPDHQVNECQVVEISKDRLLLNLRNYDKTKNARQLALSNDGGLTWYDQRFAEELIEPICHASIRAFTWNENGRRAHLFFSNPADTSKRINMTLKVSSDEGESWQVQKIIHSGPSSYSDLAMVDGNFIGCLFECGKENPYETISYVKISF